MGMSSDQGHEKGNWSLYENAELQATHLSHVGLFTSPCRDTPTSLHGMWSPVQNAKHTHICFPCLSDTACMS